MVCLDTTFLIDFLDGLPAATTLFASLQNSSDAIAVAAPSVFEMLEVVEIGGSAQERQTVEAFLSGMLVLPLDGDAAGHAAQLSAFLINAGKQIGVRDTFIAAIARLHGQTMITRNAKHFRRVPELTVMSY